MSFSTNCIFGKRWRVTSLLPFEKVKIMAAKVNLEVTEHAQNMQKMERVKADGFVEFVQLQISHLTAG